MCLQISQGTFFHATPLSISGGVASETTHAMGRKSLLKLITIVFARHHAVLAP